MTSFDILKAEAAPIIREQAVNDALAVWPVDIPALFNGGVPGDYFVTDRQYLYQDRAGTTPVTAVGQPVRAIRGSVKGTLAAVDTDGNNWTYIEENGVGFIDPSTDSRSFRISRSDVTPNQIYGKASDDKGYLIAGRVENIPANSEAGIFATDFNYFTVRFGNDRTSYDSIFSSIEDDYASYMRASRPQLDPGDRRAVTVAVVGVARNEGLNRAYVNETPPLPDGAEGYLLVIEDGASPYPIIASAPIPGPLAMPAALDLEAENPSTQTAILLFGYDTANIYSLRSRSALLVGKAVDPALHQRILEAI
jgi:hypothetical protein